VASVEDALQTQIGNIETTYGRPLREWFGLIEASGLVKHADVVALLKTKHGMAHGAAHRVSLLQRQSRAADPSSADGGPAYGLYDGKKADLRPLHDALMHVIEGLGSDVEVAPKKGYLSLRRAKQFAMIQPTTTTRIDVGLILKGTPVAGRLEDAQKFNALFTHRVRITGQPDIDADFRRWLSAAYMAAG
jgi:Domain of unknown function (DUF5655)/Domain of unknown function (DUF4287)